MKKLISVLMTLLLLPLFGDSHGVEVITDQAALEISTPSLSERRIAKIRLANGLEVYLVSDPDVDQSSAALAVEAGSWDDPAEYPGMAHFLEHMLFMGTVAYPKESEYMQYIRDSGGKVNAYTASDRTVYMFSVNNDYFAGALDRFAHFFIDPLFNPASISRELLAVDQEHAKNIENDGWRQYMVFKETGNPDHPVSKFSTGNAETLGGIPQDAMKQWYKENYSAERMHLVILSALPLDQLIEMTKTDFAAVPNHSLPSTAYPTQMTSEKQRGSMIYLKPIKDMKLLSLTWELPKELSSDMDVQAGKLIAYTLKQGSKNSLLGLLKKEELARNISSSEEKLAKDNTLFTIDVELTQKGLDQVDQVITYCFEAINRVKKTGIPQYIFNEVQQIANVKYEYQSREDAFSFVRQYAHQMVDENLKTFPRKSLIPSEYDPKMISNYIDVLTPQNCVFFVIAKPGNSGIKPTTKETWMGAEYALIPISREQLHAWEKSRVNAQITLPKPNPFIPKDFNLVYTATQDKNPSPVLLQDDNRARVYFAPDERYGVPETAYYFRLRMPQLDGSAKSKALINLYLSALRDNLFPITSAAEMAGAKIVINESNLGLSIVVKGFSGQGDAVTADLFKAVKKVRPSEDQFNIYKQALFDTYQNGARELPVLQSYETLNSILYNDAPTNLAKLTALEQIQYGDLLDFSKHLFDKVYAEAILYGNLTKSEANKTWSQISRKIKGNPYPLSEQNKRRILILPKNQGPFMVIQSTEMLGNAAALVIEQGRYSFAKRASQQVLGSILSDSFFETLRTKQQTAYIAKAWDREEERELLQLFAVQSSTHQPSELIARFELFIENIVKQFTTLIPEARFNMVRNMAIKSLEMPPENLLLMGARLFQLAFDYDGDFDLVAKRIDALERLDYNTFQKDAKGFLSRKNTRRLAVLVEGVTPKDKSFRYEVVNKQLLQNEGTFVAWK